MLDYLLPRRVSPPANYSPAKRKILDRPSTMQDVAEFVAEYINSDVGTLKLPAARSLLNTYVC